MNPNDANNPIIKKEEIKLIKNQIPIIKIKIDKNSEKDNSQNISKSLNNSKSLNYKEFNNYHPTYLTNETLTHPPLKKGPQSTSLDSIYKKGNILNPEALTSLKKQNLIKKIQSLPLPKKLYNNFLLLTPLKKTVYSLTLIICTFLTILIFTLFYNSSIHPYISNIKRTQFFCFGIDLKSEEFNGTLCIIGIGQTSVGIISIGQISYGVFALGQMSVGLFTVGQFSVGLFFVLFAQIGVGLFTYVTQFALSGVYAKCSFFSTTPIRPVLVLGKQPVMICCE